MENDGGEKKNYQKTSHTSKTNHPIPTHIKISKKSPRIGVKLVAEGKRNSISAPFTASIIYSLVKYNIRFGNSP